MHKASQIFNEIFNSKLLTLQFLKLDDLQSLYEFCEKLDNNITKEQLDEFISESFEKYFANSNNSLISSDLEKIAGGAGIYKNKFIATALATLVGFANFSISSYAKDTTDINTTTSSSMVETKNTAQSVKQKISNATKAASEFAKNGYNKTANWITKNAKKFAILVSQNPVTTVATITFTMLTVTGIGTACHLGIKNKMRQSSLINLENQNTELTNQNTESTNQNAELNKQNEELANQKLHAPSFSAPPPPAPSFSAPPPPAPSFSAPPPPPPPSNLPPPPAASLPSQNRKQGSNQQKPVKQSGQGTASPGNGLNLNPDLLQNARNGLKEQVNQSGQGKASPSNGLVLNPDPLQNVRRNLKTPREREDSPSVPLEEQDGLAGDLARQVLGRRDAIADSDSDSSSSSDSDWLSENDKTPTPGKKRPPIVPVSPTTFESPEDKDSDDQSYKISPHVRRSRNSSKTKNRKLPQSPYIKSDASGKESEKSSESEESSSNRNATRLGTNIFQKRLDMFGG